VRLTSCISHANYNLSKRNHKKYFEVEANGGLWTERGRQHPTANRPAGSQRSGNPTEKRKFKNKATKAQRGKAETDFLTTDGHGQARIRENI